MILILARIRYVEMNTGVGLGGKKGLTGMRCQRKSHK